MEGKFDENGNFVFLAEADSRDKMPGEEAEASNFDAGPRDLAGDDDGIAEGGQFSRVYRENSQTAVCLLQIPEHQEVVAYLAHEEPHCHFPLGGPQQWDVTEICDWLEYVGLGHHADLFVMCGVDGDLMMALTEQDLKVRSV